MITSRHIIHINSYKICIRKTFKSLLRRSTLNYVHSLDIETKTYTNKILASLALLKI